METANALSKQGLDKYGITLIKPSNMFASKVGRFKGPTGLGDSPVKTKETEQTPGPGSYALDPKWNDAKGIIKLKSEKHSTLSLQNPPSIPSHEHVFGYEKDDSGKLVMQTNPDKVYTGVKKDIIGPGHYSLKSTFEVKKEKGTNFHQSKSQRVLNLKQAGKGAASNLGPGQYNVDKKDIFPIYKFKKNSVFASRVERASNIKLKSIKPKKAKLTDLDDSSDSDDDNRKNQVPGPGEYGGNYLKSGFILEHKPESLQYFGSTVPRFQSHKR